MIISKPDLQLNPIGTLLARVINDIHPPGKPPKEEGRFIGALPKFTVTRTAEDSLDVIADYVETLPRNSQGGGGATGAGGRPGGGGGQSRRRRGRRPAG
jgi:hypothetical protein